MSVPRITEDIMSGNVISCTTAETLAHAHRLMRENNIRHLPVVDADTGEYAGLVTQRVILRKAFEIAATQGVDRIESAEEQVNVAEVMSRDAETVQPQLPLVEAGKYFIESKHGCLPVVVDGRLTGIITSADFVKLSVRLLEQSD